jgi:hypothetical protein
MKILEEYTFEDWCGKVVTVKVHKNGKVTCTCKKSWCNHHEEFKNRQYKKLIALQRFE